jgi:tripartite-type tricarboxylate transporter receptor subunit TctC
VVVDNKAGAGGMLAAQAVARAAADGYTVLITTNTTHAANEHLYKKLPYDPVKDFAPVTLLGKGGQIMVVNLKVPAKTVQELIALAKKEPGKLTYASAGIGTASHIPAEVMKAQTGTDILMVPYRGVAEAMTDLLAGRVDMFFVGTQIALQHVQTGGVRALAVTGSKRWKGMPDVPTMQEAGLKGYDIVNWFGLWLPAGAPADVVARIHAEVVKALADPHVQQEFDKLGLEGIGSSPEDFARFVEQQSEQTKAIARRIGAKPAGK